MKLNPDCMRAILLTLESAEYNESITFKSLCNHLKAYSEDDVSYSCIKLYEADMIEGNFIPVDNLNQPIIHSLTDITIAGHEFLANIRNDTFFEKVKDICKELSLESIKHISQVAASSATLMIKSHFGLS